VTRPLGPVWAGDGDGCALYPCDADLQARFERHHHQEVHGFNVADGRMRAVARGFGADRRRMARPLPATSGVGFCASRRACCSIHVLALGWSLGCRAANRRAISGSIGRTSVATGFTVISGPFTPCPWAGLYAAAISPHTTPATIRRKISHLGCERMIARCWAFRWSDEPL
jgi:hypothetical protein